MKAITLPEFGGPDALVLADVDTPTARAGEVLSGCPPQHIAHANQSISSRWTTAGLSN